MTADTLPLTWGPVAPSTGSKLDLIAGDRLHERDRATVEAAIHADAAAHNGRVSPNRVRAALRHPTGGMTVTPQAIGPTYRALTLAGVLVVDDYEWSDDKAGGNAGKPQRTYRLSP